MFDGPFFLAAEVFGVSIKYHLRCGLGLCFKSGVRQGRLTAPKDHSVAYYHCFSRIIERRRLIGPAEAVKFLELMRQCEAFTGVRVLTHSVLGNHFHLLLQVSRRPEVLPDDEELLRRINAFCGDHPCAAARQTLERFRSAGQHDAAEVYREGFFRRMWDLSEFMKALKQRFSQWYNRTHQRRGPLWEERFNSVLVEGAGLALASVAAYVDLNSVRAGLADDPATYRWCGYAEAMRGDARALEGVRVIMAGAERVGVDSLTTTEAMEKYRMWLYQRGEENEGTDETGKPLRRGFSREAVEAVLRARGKVSLSEYLIARVRPFCYGGVIGSRDYVEGVFTARRSRYGAKRKVGAMPCPGVDSSELHVLHRMREPLVGWTVPNSGGD